LERAPIDEARGVSQPSEAEGLLTLAGDTKDVKRQRFFCYVEEVKIDFDSSVG
jgi:hypothetical protein